MNYRSVKKYLLFPILLTSFFAAHSQQVNNHKYKVLFLGNSYTYVNNLPSVAASVALSADDTLVTDVNAIGGYTLSMHAADATSLGKIAAGTWDYVVLQEQSQLPSFSDPEVDTEVYPYAHYLDSLIGAENTCGKTMFYMTWGRKNGDTSNCPFWPPVCTYAGMDSLLNLRYRIMATANHATLSPVGAVWRHIRANYPAIELYQTDESHPTEAGTYAAAVCFYTAIFHRNPLSVTYNFTLPSGDAANIRSAVKNVVFDSLAKWHIGEYEPAAVFTSSTPSGGNVSFTNSSANATTYYWSFGDAQTSTLTNPAHHYASAGTYTVSLVAIGCGKSDTTLSIVTIGPSGFGTISSVAGVFTLVPNPASAFFNIVPGQTMENCHIQVTDQMGRTVYQTVVSGMAPVTVDATTWPAGVYFVAVVADGKAVYRAKLSKR